MREARNSSVSNNRANIDNSYDHDLYNGRIPPAVEAHGVKGVPVYAEGSGFDPATRTGIFRLAADSPGVAAGEIIPNFSDGFAGSAPDLGAHFRGEARIQYGVGSK